MLIQFDHALFLLNFRQRLDNQQQPFQQSAALTQDSIVRFFVINIAKKCVFLKGDMSFCQLIDNFNE
jgi:hypothetical protein